MNASLQRLWIRMTADKKRFGVLMGVVAVGLLMWARIIVVSNPPRRAVADEPDPVLVVAPDTGVSASHLLSDNAGADDVVIVMSSELSRDPFRINPKHFPKPTVAQEPSREVVELAPDPADDVTEEARLTALLRGVAEKLTLEAVMKGGPAVIEGRTVMLGEQFAARSDKRVAFTLVEIGERSVVVEADGRRFELRMAMYDTNESH